MNVARSAKVLFVTPIIIEAVTCESVSHKKTTLLTDGRGPSKLGPRKFKVGANNRRSVTNNPLYSGVQGRSLLEVMLAKLNAIQNTQNKITKNHLFYVN